MSDLERSGLTFTKPELTAINGEPTPATMTLLQSELNGNAISVASNRGGGQFGHLALTLSGANYLAVAHEAFVTPPNPGNTPIHGEAPTAHQITESNRAFLVAKSEYKLYLAVGQALKKQLPAAVGDIYVNELAHPTLRYARVTVRNLLAHLFLTYGQTTLDQLKANTTEFERPWDPSKPIESLWKRVQDCRAFAKLGNDPISLATTVRTVLLIIEKTGVFTLNLRFFRMQAAVALTWPALKQHFTEANTNWKRQLTSRQCCRVRLLLEPRLKQELPAHECNVQSPSKRAQAQSNTPQDDGRQQQHSSPPARTSSVCSESSPLGKRDAGPRQT
jgi:hypothetical protein